MTNQGSVFGRRRIVLLDIRNDLVLDDLEESRTATRDFLHLLAVSALGKKERGVIARSIKMVVRLVGITDGDTDQRRDALAVAQVGDDRRRQRERILGIEHVDDGTFLRHGLAGRRNMHIELVVDAVRCLG